MANHKSDKKGGAGQKRTYTSEFDEDDQPAGKGHNRVGGVETPKLKSYIERLERLAEEKAGIQADITDVFAEAKSNGFDVKAMRKIIAARKLKATERAEQEYMYDLYARALGMTTEELDSSLD